MAGRKGRSGRPPKPQVLQLADGTHRADRHGEIGAEFDPGDLPEKPHFENAAASDLWDEVVGPLVTLGVAKVTDGPMLQSMCEIWGLYRASYSIAEQDPTDKDARIAVTSYWAKFETAASRFGLNASDRGRLKLDKPKPTGIVARKRG